MNAQAVSRFSINTAQFLLRINFIAAMFSLVIAAVSTLAGSERFFQNGAELYGPLANNLRVVLLYLCFVQVAVCVFYFSHRNYMAVVSFGFILLVMMIALDFYAEVNHLQIDSAYKQLFLYSGLSHIAYGGIRMIRD